MRRKLLLAAISSIALFTLIFSSLHYQQASAIIMAKKIPSTSIHVVPPSDQAKNQQYVLEIIGMGVSFEKYRQGALWEALSGGGSYTSIRDFDPKHYPWNGQDKMWEADSNENDSAENAILDTPRYWGIPTFNAEPRYSNESDLDRPDLPQEGIAASEVLMRIPVLVDRELSDRPDRIVARIFDFFDKNPSVPYILLGSADSTTLRTRHQSGKDWGSLKDGWYVPKDPSASVAFVLARRERVDALRPFVFEDLDEGDLKIDNKVLNREAVARRVWLNYLALKKKVPSPPPSRYDIGSHIDRVPTGSEWLSDLEIFSRQFSVQKSSESHLSIAELFRGGRRPRISPQWKPIPWFPVPWNSEQLEQFDALPTLGFLHRPVFVRFADSDGQPLKQTDERQAALQAGWQSALETLPDSQRRAGPSRVIVATGGNSSQLIEFHRLLHHLAENGGRKFDPDKPTELINTDHRLGNTGAATFFMQAAIGVLGSYRDGGVSAAVNLRDPSEASIVFISPPSEEKRKSQHHVIGGDIFRNATTPAIDPKNYEEPAFK